MRHFDPMGPAWARLIEIETESQSHWDQISPGMTAPVKDVAKEFSGIPIAERGDRCDSGKVESATNSGVDGGLRDGRHMLRNRSGAGSNAGRAEAGVILTRKIRIRSVLP